MAAKTEGVAQRHDVSLGEVAGRGHHVQRDLRILVLQVDRHRRLAVVHSQNRQNSFDGTGGSQEVAHLRLRSGHSHVVHVVAKSGAERGVLGLIPDRGGGGVRVDVNHILSLDPAIEHGGLEGAGCTEALRVRGGDVVGVRSDGGAGELTVDAGAAGQCVLLGFEHQGAGALVLEAEEHALARGARIYGELAGTSVTSDAYHITAPDPQGLGATRALKAAMFDGRIQAEDVVHVNAHATSTPVGDKPEYTALRAALGNHVDNVAVSATKSQMGHLLGASGAVEAVLTVLAVYDRKAPVTINLENQDPEIPLDVVTSARDLPQGNIVALSNSFGFGGHNAVVAVRSV